MPSKDSGGNCGEKNEEFYPQRRLHFPWPAARPFVSYLSFSLLRTLLSFLFFPSCSMPKRGQGSWPLQTLNLCFFFLEKEHLIDIVHNDVIYHA